MTARIVKENDVKLSRRDLQQIAAFALCVRVISTRLAKGEGNAMDLEAMALAAEKCGSIAQRCAAVLGGTRPGETWDEWAMRVESEEHGNG